MLNPKSRSPSFHSAVSNQYHSAVSGTHSERQAREAERVLGNVYRLPPNARSLVYSHLPKTQLKAISKYDNAARLPLQRARKAARKSPKKQWHVMTDNQLERTLQNRTNALRNAIIQHGALQTVYNRGAKQADMHRGRILKDLLYRRYYESRRVYKGKQFFPDLYAWYPL